MPDLSTLTKLNVA
uniref:Uncharacterized protein n=1 Tax=Arundo donax TaxID=35708 RepID=A0A0A8Z8I7_ARUDO